MRILKLPLILGRQRSRRSSFLSDLEHANRSPHTRRAYRVVSLQVDNALLAARAPNVTRETVRQWCRKFGQEYANRHRQRRARPGDKWHLDEVFLKINGKTHHLWRAVDQHGNVLDIVVQSRRNKAAAKKFFRKPLKGCECVPRVIITDKLASYGVVHRGHVIWRFQSAGQRLEGAYSFQHSVVGVVIPQM